MKNLLLKFLDFCAEKINKVRKRIVNSSAPYLTLTYIKYDIKGRNISFTLTNNHLLEDKQMLKAIFDFLMTNDKFINFGFHKVIIVKAVINPKLSFMLHHNILLTNNTLFKEYYDKVEYNINKSYSNGGSSFQVDSIPRFEILVWNMDDIRNTNIKLTKSTLSDYKLKKLNDNFGLQKSKLALYKSKLGIRSYHNYIKALKNIIPLSPKSFACMDIESMEFKNKQIPVSISLANEDDKELFMIKCPKIMNTNSLNLAVDELWVNLFTYLIKNSHNYNTIFMHNLGSFDGYFNYKALSNHFDPDRVKTIIDHHNKFIKISLKLDHIQKEIVWLDSYRIFPVSLKELCKTFGGKGKLSKYKHKFNNFDVFKNENLLNEFKQYALQDSIALFDALIEAQKLYISQYNVDVTSILSSSTLSLKIFRQNFLDINIPILKGSEDNYIRTGYFGGHTDYYKAYITEGYYYDINSLYPFAMCKPMPHKLIKFYDNMTNIKLENFFGFCLAEITTPKNILKPLLPYKHEGKLIYPTGTWLGVYFSEELKAVQNRGYKITLLNGYEFSQISLFNKYVEHFYHKKKNSSGATRFIAKMHLNQLYGIFGRKKELIHTINIYRKDLHKYLSSRIIKSIIDINDDIITILIQNNLNDDIVEELNIFFETDIYSSYYEVRNNVALASAVTSYARIHMMDFICNNDIAYTDTDSIICSNKLDDKFISKELGLMKDELDGHLIQEAYFLDNKKYGYWMIGQKTYSNKIINESELVGIELNSEEFINKYGYWITDKNDNTIINRSVIAGVDRNSILFNDVRDIFNGKTIIKDIPFRFYKSFKDLSITVSSTKTSIKKSNDKQLINNYYIPKNIINLNHNLDNRSLFIKIKNKYINLIKHYLKL